MKRIAAFVLSVMLLVSVVNGIVVLGETNPFEASDKAFLSTVAVGLQSFDPATISNDRELQAVPEKFMIVQIKDTVSMQALSTALDGIRYDFIGRSTDRTVNIPVTQFAQFSAKHQSLIAFSSKDTVRKLTATPNDLVYSGQWALKKMNFPKAWNITKGSIDVRVGVIDTGIIRTHADLVGENILNGYDVLKDLPVMDDKVGHGTCVSSIIGATTNNKLCMAGGAWNVSIIPIKVSNTGSIMTSSILKAIAYAIESKCKIVNLSLGGGRTTPFDQYYINKLNQTGCIIVAAAGNGGNSGYMYPASSNKVISVGAIDIKSKITYYSQINDKVDCAAAGDYVLAAANTASGYRLVQGTSFSSPYATAVIALMCAVYPALTHDELQKVLPSICDDAGAKGKDSAFGYGIMNAEKAVKKAVQLQSLYVPTPSPTPAVTPTPLYTPTPAPG
ncbi:MAG: S8 family serine peptidase [Clostridia bacterium]